MSSWYSNSGQQLWGLRFINFLQETLGTTLLQGLDKLIVYNLMKNLRAFYFDYNIYMGQIKLSKADMEQFNPKLKDLPPYMDSLKQFEKQLNGNFESLSDNHMVFYQNMVKNMNPKMASDFCKRISLIGQY